MPKPTSWRSGPRPTRFWPVFSRVFAITFVTMTLWALASPLMSVPDEQVHAVRAAAVVRGDWEGTPSSTEPWLSWVEVPRYVANSQELRCFAGDPKQTPVCQEFPAKNQNELTSAYTTATSNSPLFYAIIGLPTLILSGTDGLYGMRLVAAFLCSTLLAFAFASLTHLPSWRWSSIALTVATTPMVLYLGGSLNPNGLEAASMAALFSTLVVTLSTSSEGRVLWWRLTVISISATLLANTRSIAVLWVLLAVIGAVLLAKRTIMAALAKRYATWVAAGTTTIGVGAALLWYVTPHGLGAAPPFAGVGTQPLIAFQLMLDRTVEYGLGWVGYFGWLDRPAPDAAVIWWAVLIVGIVVSSVVLASTRGRLSVLFWIAAAVLVPATVQAAVVTELGYIWQGRYTLAIFVCMLVAAGVLLDRSVPQSISLATSRLLSTGIWLTGLAHVATFVWVLRRYVVGSDAAWSEMVLRPEWQPPLGWIPLALFFAATVFAGAFALDTTLKRIALVRELSSEPSTSLRKSRTS